ncbi:hypothetical protein PC113_g22094 [Phytophthora cactorum]|uniref:Uncharacterized protein n=1 Tax=Phytophthora cactorum TaxID=29920 RepID=A0A8T0XY94_9STRA|nr:hypothetical protein PC112_g22197 [Phytophthora cactorum]KAG2824045.1 hypothetical protein PC113_g22094 [Phytophthora cactorum]KAG2882210.1 hypothetical protein PC115_g22008 [Phytophthora cactorum]KAG3128028.1 hypothetical protein C6341_g24738 [Phytophthora cactorum]
MDEEITETEVASALKKRKRDNACGPDELGNDSYLDNDTFLVPVLTKLFNACLDTGKTLRSFDEDFISIDLLYDEIDSDTTLGGIRLASKGSQDELKVAGGLCG